MVQHNVNKVLNVKSKSRPNEESADIKKRLGRRFVQFCKTTDLHGFKYIVEEDLSSCERTTWTVAVVLSIFFATYFVITAYNWYARNPIVTVIESTQGAIWDVPFPSVTICDLNLVSKINARNLANTLHLKKGMNLTSNDLFNFLQLAPLLYSKYIVSRAQLKSLLLLQQVLDHNNMSIDTLFQRLSPLMSCDRLLARCMWKNTIYRCDKIFERIFVENTYCCTFNYFAIEESPNKASEYNVIKAPRRVASCGSQTALTVLINNDLENYFSTPIASQGVLAIVDNAYNQPTYESPIRVVNPFTEVRIALSPERTYANPGLRAFSPEKRNCYYNNEMKLSVFRKYTFHNCVAFKKVEIIMNACDCVPLRFPTNGPMQDRINFKEVTQTQCLPECEHFDYPLEVALGKLTENGKRFTGLPFFDDVNLQNKSLLSVFFNDLVSTRYRRDVYLNWQNILATFGGLLSLMLGFTLISGFDLLIFLTFRPAYDSTTYIMKLLKDKPNNLEINSQTVFSKTDSWVDPVKIYSGMNTGSKGWYHGNRY